jgi:hypothetical protein
MMAIRQYYYCTKTILSYFKDYVSFTIKPLHLHSKNQVF